MVSQDIKNIYKNKSKIIKDFFKQDPERQHALDLYNKTISDSNAETQYIPVEMKKELKQFYLDKIGEENIKNSPDYDVDLVFATESGGIRDFNFPKGFAFYFIVSLVIDFVLYFLFGLGVIYLGGILSILCALGAWLGPLFLTVAIFMDARDDEKNFTKSAKKSPNDVKKVATSKYAPIIAFLILVIVNVWSLHVLIYAY